jgi:steroid 5-alpha reductase family enzyme
MKGRVEDAAMPFIITFAIVLIGLVLVFCAAWLWQRRTKNAGMVDPVWAMSLGVVALVIAACGTGAPVNRAFVAVGGALWGLRLGRHLWMRNHGKPEDPRYHAFREQWGADADRKMFGFFQLQAGISLLLAIAFFVPAYAADAASPLAIVAGVIVWLVAVAGEGIADRQLKRFAADPAHRGQVCRDGLWRYSRHPNYFFEWLHWFSYCAFAIGAPNAALALSGPILMYGFLRYLSGIPFTEAQALRTRGDSYRAYQARTSMLFPWPPRRERPASHRESLP